jgi:hypothetical protein
MLLGDHLNPASAFQEAPATVSEPSWDLKSEVLALPESFDIFQRVSGLVHWADRRFAGIVGFDSLRSSRLIRSKSDCIVPLDPSDRLEIMDHRSHFEIRRAEPSDRRRQAVLLPNETGERLPVARCRLKIDDPKTILLVILEPNYCYAPSSINLSNELERLFVFKPGIREKYSRAFWQLSFPCIDDLMEHKCGTCSTTESDRERRLNSIWVSDIAVWH